MMRRGVMLVLALTPQALFADPALDQGGVIVTINLVAMRNTKGVIRACLTAKPAAWPGCEKDPAAHLLNVPAKDGAVLAFRHVAPGMYAVSLFHDENGNGRLDKRLGIPTEGYGFSRDAPIRVFLPSFAAAQFPVGTSDVTQKITIRYML